MLPYSKTLIPFSNFFVLQEYAISTLRRYVFPLALKTNYVPLHISEIPVPHIHREDASSFIEGSDFNPTVDFYSIWTYFSTHHGLGYSPLLVFEIIHVTMLE